MKKILVFTSTFPKFTQGDATPPFVYELSQRLAQQGLDIVVLTPRIPGSKNYEEKDNMKIYRYPYFFKSSWEKLNDGAILPNIKKNKRLILQVPFLLLGGFFSLIKIVKKEKIKTIHSHWLIPQGLLAVLYKKLINKKIKILCTSHGSDLHSLGGGILNAVKKFVISNVDKLTVVSNFLKDEVTKLHIKKLPPIEVISMGVDTDKFHPNNYDENIRKQYNITGPFLLFVGRLSPEKGVNYLIEAMPGVIKEYPDAKLMLIGTGPLENEIKQQAKKLKIENNLIWKGWVDHKDLAPYFATADIFVGPSLKESFGLVFVESILSGCIAIGSNIYGAITDIIKEGENGFLVDIGNTKDIEHKIVYCINNLSQIKSKKEDIRKSMIDQFSWEFISKKYFSLFK